MKDKLGDAFIEWAESQGFVFVDCEAADMKGNKKIIRTMKVDKNGKQIKKSIIKHKTKKNEKSNLT